MKITSLKLRGFIGIKKGLGLDEISLDFSKLSGLVALAGPNGHGKTTILDNLSPYRVLASRNKSLQHHVFLRDSIKELCFEFAGDTYRTLIKIDAESDRTEGFIWKNDVPQVDGKVSEYDRYITALFGSQQLFFSSVFCAQNAEKISDMTTGELKKLFSEFLRLDRLVEFENTAKQCVGLLTAKADGLHRDILAAQESLKGKEDIENTIGKWEVYLDGTRALVKTMQAELKDSERDLETARAAAANNTIIRQRIEDMEANFVRLEKEIAADSVSAENALSGLRAKTRSILNEIEAADKLLAMKAMVEDAAYKMAGIESAMALNAEKLSESHKAVNPPD